LGQGGESEEGVREALDPPALFLQAGEVLSNGGLVGCVRASEELQLDVDRAQGAAYLMRRRSCEACKAAHAGSADIFIECHRARDRGRARSPLDNLLASPPAPRQCAPRLGCPLVEMGPPDRVGCLKSPRNPPKFAAEPSMARGLHRESSRGRSSNEATDG